MNEKQAVPAALGLLLATGTWAMAPDATAPSQVAPQAMNDAAGARNLRLAQADLNQSSAASPAAAKAGDSNQVIENIVVTARKRDETAQSVGAALSVFSANRLSLIGADNAAGLAASVPGLVIGSENADLKVMIRGVGSDNIQAYSDPGVAFHIDGVYQARATGGNALFYDVARVEVLRGPQGTLYGRNATGGAVNVISREPSNRFEALGDVAFGNYGREQVRGAVNVPIVSELLALRLTGTHEQHDGYENNLFAGGTDGGAVDDQTWRAQLLFTPLDNVKLVLRASDVRNDGTGPGRKRVATAPGNCQDCGYIPPIADLRTVNKDTPESMDGGKRSYSGTLDWDLGGSAFTLIAATETNHVSLQADVDQSLVPFGTPGGITAVATFAQRSKQQSVEARLASTSTGPWDWLVGGFYLEEEPRRNTLINRQSFVPATIHNVQDVRAQSVAAFGQLGYKLTDKLKATVGLRYSDDEKRGVGGTMLTIDPPGPTPPFTSGTQADRALGTWGKTTWKAGLEWQLQPEHLLYASVSSGYKAGGFNIGNLDVGNYEPEEVIAYELGSKSLFANDSVQLNTSAFYYDYNNLQVFQIVNQATLITNAKGAEVYGVELEGQFRPLGGLQFDGNVSFLHATYSDFLQASNLFFDTAPGTPLPAGWGSLGLPEFTRPGVAGQPILFNLAGNNLVNAPRTSGRIGAQYSFDLAGGVLTSRVQAYHQTKVFFRPLNLDPYDAQDAYTKVDLRMIYARDAWSLELFADNLTDKTVVSNVEVTDSGVYFANLRPPRVYGVRLEAHF